MVFGLPHQFLRVKVLAGRKGGGRRKRTHLTPLDLSPRRHTIQGGLELRLQGGSRTKQCNHHCRHLARSQCTTLLTESPMCMSTGTSELTCHPCFRRVCLGSRHKPCPSMALTLATCIISLTAPNTIAQASMTVPEEVTMALPMTDLTMVGINVAQT